MQSGTLCPREFLRNSLTREAHVGNYIIRIYRQEKNNPEKLVGVLEKVGEGNKKSNLRATARRQAFTNIDELWEILNATGNLPRRSSLSSPRPTFNSSPLVGEVARRGENRRGEGAKGKQKQRR